MRKPGFDIILLGAPASGKDTQAKLLEREFALKPVESGKYLRGLQNRKTPTGELVRRSLNRGLPAPVSIIKEFISANVRLSPKDRNLLFIGNPRLKPEAEYLRKVLLESDHDYMVFYINLPVKEIWVRSEKRMRNADDTKYVQTRINWHKKQVGKTIKYFEKLGKLKFINGNQTIKEVNREIIRAINDYRKFRTSKVT